MCSVFRCLKSEPKIGHLYQARTIHRPLGDVEGEFAAWSPDGRTVAFAYGHAIYLTEDEGITSRRLVDTPGNVSWIRLTRAKKNLWCHFWCQLDLIFGASMCVSLHNARSRKLGKYGHCASSCVSVRLAAHLCKRIRNPMLYPIELRALTRTQWDGRPGLATLHHN